MELFWVAFAWLVFLLYCLSSVGKNYFGREVMAVSRGPQHKSSPRLSVVVPARNEELNIERCLRSLLKQTYPTDKYEIIVVDDNSTDRTAALVRSIADDHPGLALYQAEPLPAGWTGKNHACWTGVQHASGDWLCFVDADVVAEPRLMETATRFAAAKQLGLLSLNPFQELVSFAERCLLPGIFFAIASSMNFKNVRNPGKPEAVANGQFMFFKRQTYNAIGGHRSVRGEIMEDMALAAIVKKSGSPIGWIFGENLLRTRMYRSVSNIWEGFSKNLLDIMGVRSPAAAIFNCVKSFLLAWMPLVLAVWTCFAFVRGGQDIFGYGTGALVFAACVAMMVAALFTVRFLRIAWWYLLCFPLGLTMHSALTIGSLWRSTSGRRKWKGRLY
jgi:chlorobactene glucosyltransferase